MILLLKSRFDRFRQIFALLLFVAIFYWYYEHMKDFYKNKIHLLKKEVTKKEKIKTRNISKDIEKLIYKEAERCVELIGQEKIQSVKVIKDKLLIVADWDSNIEPVFIRYGVLALIKSTPQNIKIAIDLKYLVESRYRG